MKLLKPPNIMHITLTDASRLNFCEIQQTVVAFPSCYSLWFSCTLYVPPLSSNENDRMTIRKAFFSRNKTEIKANDFFVSGVENGGARSTIGHLFQDWDPEVAPPCDL